MKKIRLIDFDIITKVYSWLFWNTKSPIKWNWLEFSSLREYEPWDNVKFIDWLISAREWKPYIKEYEEDKDLNVFFLIDTWKFMWFWSDDFIKIDLSDFIFKTIWLSAIAKGYSVSGITFDNKIKKIFKPSKNKSTVFDISKNLVLSDADSDFEKVLEKFNSLNIKNSLVFVLTDNDEIKNEKLYKVASQKNDLIYINIFDYFENFLWEKWIFNFINSNMNILSNLSSNNRRDNYIKIRKEKIRKFRKTLFKNRIMYLYLDQKRDIYRELINLLKK